MGDGLFYTGICKWQLKLESTSRCWWQKLPGICFHPFCTPFPSICSTPSGLAETFCSPLSVSSLAFSRSSDTWSPELGVAGRLRVLGVICLGQQVQGWMAFGGAHGTKTHPPVANVCEEDHTPLFSFIIHSLLASHLMLELMLCYIRGSFSWHNYGLVSIFWCKPQNKGLQRQWKEKWGNHNQIISSTCSFIPHPSERFR